MIEAEALTWIQQMNQENPSATYGLYDARSVDLTIVHRAWWQCIQCGSLLESVVRDVQSPGISKTVECHSCNCIYRVHWTVPEFKCRCIGVVEEDYDTTIETTKET